MARTMTVALLFLHLLSAGLTAQDTVVLEGNVHVDVSGGRIAADLCLRGMRPDQDTMRFVLHRGMNVKRVRLPDSTTLSYATAPEPHGVGLRYAVVPPPPEGAAADAPYDAVCVEYAGGFPVYDVASGDYRESDGSAVVAFNGRTLRMRGETRWYPQPFDAAEERITEALRFRLSIECAECARIYVNGAPPAAGPTAHLESAVPREILILAGDYPVVHAAGMLFLGEELAQDTARLLAGRMAGIQDFFSEYLGTAYGPQPDILRIIPVRQDRIGQMWGFFSDPALGIAGLPLGLLLRILDDPQEPGMPALFGFLAHELAHRYFGGGVHGSDSPLFSEPFAVVLELKASRMALGEDLYRRRVGELYARAAAAAPMAPLDRADRRTLGTDDYRYAYAPLLLLALEQHIGETRFRSLLRELLSPADTEPASSAYAFLRRAASRAGVSATEWQAWEARCTQLPIADNVCLRQLAHGEVSFSETGSPAGLLLPRRPAAGQGQPLRPSASQWNVQPPPFSATVALAGSTSARAPTAQLVAAGAAGGLVGVLAGAFIGYHMEGGDSGGEDPGVNGAVFGWFAGSALATPLAVHLAGDGRGSLTPAYLAAFGLAAVGICGTVLLESPGGAVFLVGVPLAQIASAIAIHRRTSR